MCVEMESGRRMGERKEGIGESVEGGTERKRNIFLIFCLDEVFRNSKKTLSRIYKKFVIYSSKYFMRTFFNAQNVY